MYNFESTAQYNNGSPIIVGFHFFCFNIIVFDEHCKEEIMMLIFYIISMIREGLCNIIMVGRSMVDPFFFFGFRIDFDIHI